MIAIREIRKRLNMSQADLAEKLGTSVPTVCRYENGERSPDLATAARIANALGCKVDDLIKEESA